MRWDRRATRRVEAESQEEAIERVLGDIHFAIDAAPVLTEDESVALTGFNAMGKTIPMERRQRALDAVREMVPGISTEDAMSLVGRVADKLERDQPYEALREATAAPIAIHSSSPTPTHTPQPGVRLDVTGGYRLLATLLT